MLLHHIFWMGSRGKSLCVLDSSGLSTVPLQKGQGRHPNQHSIAGTYIYPFDCEHIFLKSLVCSAVWRLCSVSFDVFQVLFTQSCPAYTVVLTAPANLCPFNRQISIQRFPPPLQMDSVTSLTHTGMPQICVSEDGVSGKGNKCYLGIFFKR